MAYTLGIFCIPVTHCASVFMFGIDMRGRKKNTMMNEPNSFILRKSKTDFTESYCGILT